MAKTVVNIKVLIASPSDVKKEREELRNRLFEYNDISNCRFQPWLWEFDLESTLTKDIQTLINKKVKDVDLVILIFKSRFGSPTKRAGSGTEEEFLNAIKKKRPVIAYFLQNNVNTTSMSSDELKQIEAIKNFQIKCRDLISSHDNVTMESIMQRYLNIDLKANTDRILQQMGMSRDGELDIKLVKRGMRQTGKVTWEGYLVLIRGLYEKLNKSEASGGYAYDIIIGINKCGLLAGVMLGRMTGREKQVVGIYSDNDKSFTSNVHLIPNDRIVDAINDNDKIKKILVIDTINRSARSFPNAIDYLRKRISPDKEIKTALLVSNSKTPVTCDYVMCEIRRGDIVFPYNAVSSGFYNRT